MSATSTMYPWLLNRKLYDFKDKETNTAEIVGRMLSRTSRIFEYENLPESIDRAVLELYMQTNGYVIIKETNGKLYAYNAGLGGEPNVYYEPTIATIANPSQNLSGNFTIGEDCLLVKNDSMAQGLLPVIRKYASLLAENELSMYLGLINTRITSIMTAKDDNQKEALDTYIEDIVNGSLHSVFDDSFALDGIKIQPYANSSFSNNLVQLTEIEQYLMGTLYRELGLKGAYNTKRENISEAESKVGDETLMPLIDDMLMCRQEALDEINAKYGTNISVSLCSSWEEQAEEQAEEQEEEPKRGLIEKLLGKGGKDDEEEAND